MRPALMPIRRLLPAAMFLLLAGAAIWLRGPGFGHSLWNVDEAIHATAARVILDGGVLYRDAVDQRTPLSYYAFAAAFSLFGENNLAAVRCLIALIVAATGTCLFLSARRLGGMAAGLGAAFTFVLLGSSALFPGDANAANTEWFSALFASAGAAVMLTSPEPAGSRRVFISGLLFGCAFLSKQPALLEAAAPLAALIGSARWRGRPWGTVRLNCAFFALGWLAPVVLAAGGFAAAGALPDAVYYTWTYNLNVYGPEIDAGARMLAAARPLTLVGGAAPWLLVCWAVWAVISLHRLLQRTPAPGEGEGNPSLAFAAVWSVTGLAAAASGGRDFDHYTIHFLPPFSLGAGLAIGFLVRDRGPSPRGRLLHAIALLVTALVAGQAGYSAIKSRQRILPDDPSRRVAEFIRSHSGNGDRIFVWGFHPDIYLFSGRLPSSRFLYGSFLSGLVPWTNTAPDRDTGYAIVPGARETLMAELAARPPAYIVDCSAGPNRHWQKYPLSTFPALEEFVRREYLPVESGQFVPQGFRLFRRRLGDEPAPLPVAASVSPSQLPQLAIPTLGSELAPARGSAPQGISRSIVEGRSEYFAHAPSTLCYRLTAAYSGLRGGFGIKPAAYAADNPHPTDGAVFIIRWRPSAGPSRVLMERALRPGEDLHDRGLQSFSINLPQEEGELELVVDPGPAGQISSDWTYWTDLVLITSR